MLIETILLIGTSWKHFNSDFSGNSLNFLCEILQLSLLLILTCLSLYAIVETCSADKPHICLLFNHNGPFFYIVKCLKSTTHAIQSIVILKDDRNIYLKCR